MRTLIFLWRLLIINIFFVFINANITPDIHKHNNENIDRIIDNNEKQIILQLKQVCSDKCLDELKDDAVCLLFCAFVDHIAEYHGSQLLELYYNSGKKFDPLEWAVVDTIHWKIQEKSDDDHELAAMYIEKVKYWYDYLWRRDEL